MSKDQESGQTEDEQTAKSELSQTDDSQSSESAQQNDGSSSDLAKQFDGVAKGLKSEFQDSLKKAQSSKDKQFASQRKEIDQLKESVVILSQKLQEKGASAPVSRGNEDQESALSAVQDVFVVAGFEKDKVLNSPEFIDYVKVSNGKFDTSGALKYLKELKSKPKVEISAAAVAQRPGDGAREPDANDLVNEYSNEMIAARGKPSELKAIKAKYKNQGVDVDNVGFKF